MSTNLRSYSFIIALVGTLSLLMPTGVRAQGAIPLNYHVLELPPVGGLTQSVATSINDRNEIVGSSFTTAAAWNWSATKWIADSGSALGKVAKGNYSLATSINLSGRVVGDADDGSFRPNAVLFGTGAPKFLTKAFNNSHAIFVADSGFIVGNAIKGFDNKWLPVIWTEDPKKAGQFTVKYLPLMTDPTGAATYNFAMAANNVGHVVGTVSNSKSGPRAALWNNNVAHSLRLLPELPGQWGAYANGINDDGVIVGVNDVGIFGSTPVVWAADAARTIAALPLFPGEVHGSATAINSGGQIIGSHGDQALPAIWIHGQIFDLQSTLDSSGAGWVLETVTDINNLGFIIGTGTKNGQQRGFMLTRVIVGPF